MAESASRGRNGERGDVAVPGEVVGLESRGFERLVRINWGEIG